MVISPKQEKWLKRLRQLMVFWAVGASLAYLAQKATANYTFDWSILKELEYHDRFEPLLPEIAGRGKARILLLPDDQPAGNKLMSDRRRWVRYLLIPYWTDAGNARYVVVDLRHQLKAGAFAEKMGWTLIKANGTAAALFEKAKVDR